MSNLFGRRVTRRQALEVFGIGAAAAALPTSAFAQGPTFAKGAIIRTILKDYAPEELAGGATLFHEHFQLGLDFNQKFQAASAAARAANGLPPQGGPGGGAAKGGGAPKGDAPKGDAAKGGGAPKGPAPAKGPDIMRDPDLMAAEVKKAAMDGNIACIVEAGHPEMGRDINFVRQVAMKSGSADCLSAAVFIRSRFYPKEISTMTEDQIFKALIKQADDDVVGVWGEIGSWDEITADERKVFRAVGRAHVATNIPIFTRTPGFPGKSALEQLDILEDEGVKPDRVVIRTLGEFGRCANVTVQKILCRRVSVCRVRSSRCK